MGILSALMGVGGAPLCMSYLTVATDLPHHLVQGWSMVPLCVQMVFWARKFLVGTAHPLISFFALDRNNDGGSTTSSLDKRRELGVWWPHASPGGSSGLLRKHYWRICRSGHNGLRQCRISIEARVFGFETFSLC